MSLASRLARVAVFLGVVLLVVVVSSAGSFLVDVGGQPPEPTEYDEYDVSSIVPDRAESGGEPSVERADGTGLVLIDRAHANRFATDEIKPLVSAIAGTGYRVEYARETASFDDALARADALVVIDPGRSYSTSEVDRVETFVDRGGRVALLGEPSQIDASEGSPGAGLSEAHNRLTSLSIRFGIDFGADYLYNMHDNDGNFRRVVANADGDGPLADGVERVAFSTPVEVDGVDAEPFLVASDETRSSRNDAEGEYALGARAGNVVAVGDTSFLRRGNYDVLGNDVLVGNLASFLVDADRVRTLDDYPAVVDADPSVRYTSAELLDAAQSLRDGQRGRATLSLATGSVPDDTDVLVTTFEHLEDGDEGTGIDVRGDTVSVPGYRSETSGVAVLRSPEDGDLDLVIAADGPASAERAASLLADGDVEGYLLDDRTAVIRPSAVTTAGR